MAILNSTELKKRIWEACKEPECGPKKSGSVLEVSMDGKRAHFRDCRCMVQFRKQAEYLRSNIPERFWGFSYKDLTKAFKQANATHLGLFKMWVEDLEMVFEEHAYLTLWSADHGAAKSALASVPARAILDETAKLDPPETGRRVFWISGMDLFDDLRRADEDHESPLDRLAHTDFIVIDEVDKIYFPDESRLSWERLITFFNRIYDQKIPILATSNKSLPELQKLQKSYPSSTLSRLSEANSLEFRGVDFRSKASFMDDLIKRRAKDGS